MLFEEVGLISRRVSGVKAPDPLAANDLEGHVYIPAGGVRIRTNLGMGLLDEPLKVSLRKGLVFDVHPHCKAKAAPFARADGDSTRHLGLARILLVLLTDEVQGAAKASRIASGEEMLGCGGSGFTCAAHFFGSERSAAITPSLDSV
jgi:hypothetical protein